MASNLVTGWPPIINREAVTCPQHSRILRVTGRTNASWQYTSKLRPLTGLYWCSAMTSVCKYQQLTRAKFWACPKLVYGQIGLACTLAGKSDRDLCEGLPRKVWQGLYGSIRRDKIRTAPHEARMGHVNGRSIFVEDSSWTARTGPRRVMWLGA